MPWIQIRIHATEQNAETISDYLMDTGSLSVTFMDGKDTPIYEPALGEVKYWADTIVIGLYDATEDMDAVVGYLKQQPILIDNFHYKIEALEDKDWSREWMDNFHPMKFGQRLWICPSWRDVPDPTAVNILLDPGLAFGTGTHPTTALCLEWLDGLDLSDKTVVDFGCGSGILAIAALKLGAKRVIGIDIDPQAIQASEENAKRNGVEQQLELYLPKDQPQLEADVVVANILAGPLKELHSVITAYARPGADIALSGILEVQAESLQEVYQQNCQLDPIKVVDEWVRVSGKKV
ncbi:MAG: ribosomal protein L11 methyltransferase [Phenylobacterium sp.]|jgi:ribosomal protein L11 methyltransferase